MVRICQKIKIGTSLISNFISICKFKKNFPFLVMFLTVYIFIYFYYWICLPLFIRVKLQQKGFFKVTLNKFNSIKAKVGLPSCTGSDKTFEALSVRRCRKTLNRHKMDTILKRANVKSEMSKLSNQNLNLFKNTPFYLQILHLNHVMGNKKN